jgi:transcriptional regulator with XRE-family HTH domain
MDQVKLGALLRAIRMKRGWRQEDLALETGVSRSLVSQIERGRFGGTTLKTLRTVAGALEVTVDIVARWRGADGDRILNAGHAQLHERIARLLDSLEGWVHSPEVAFAIYSERGVIDILAFHQPTRSVLVIELKTEIASLEDLLTVMSRRARLAPKIAAERGWQPATVSSLVVIAEGDSNRRQARRYASTLRAAFPSDGHDIRTWLRRPARRINALSFWANATGSGVTDRAAARKRVRRR